MEVIMGLQLCIGLICIAISSFFAMCGGRSNDELKMVHLDLWGWNKANRFWGRVFSPTILALTIIGLSLWTNNFKWPVFAFIAHYSIALRFGHSKPYQRVIKALAWTSAGLWLCLITGLWWVLIAQLIIGITAQIIFGTKNPLVAPREELIIYFSMSFLFSAMIL